MYAGIELVVRIVLAHFVADYLLQPKEMAVRKSERSMIGNGYAVLHCMIYAGTFNLFLWTANHLLFLWVWLSHFIIDRFALTNHWLKLIRGRSIKDEILVGRDYEISFACIVYVITDATLHFLLLAAIFKWVW